MAETNRELVERIYRAALAGVDPGACVRAALDPEEYSNRRTFIVALGKAAEPMAGAALESVVAPALVIDPTTGDHPIPGERSAHAAARLESFLAPVQPGDRVLILLSGGTSSLIAAPVDGIPQSDLTTLFQLLLGSGLDIHAMNLVRKRFCRWGAGRLATRVTGAFVRVLAISDVSGDRVESIGSGPCAPDSSTAADVQSLLKEHGLWNRIPESMKRSMPETPKPGDPAFDRVSHTIIANNQSALESAARCAGTLGLLIEVGPELCGEAADMGTSIARLTHRLPSRSCLLLGGETTVVLGETFGRGGRCQELALAAGLEFERLVAHDVTLLAAGTDGRDGPTDAAGAVVDGTTASRIRAAGLDPHQYLQQHNSYSALDSANALLRTGSTRTNVQDVVVAIRSDS